MLSYSVSYKPDGVEGRRRVGSRPRPGGPATGRGGAADGRPGGPLPGPGAPAVGPAGGGVAVEEGAADLELVHLRSSALCRLAAFERTAIHGTRSEFPRSRLLKLTW